MKYVIKIGQYSHTGKFQSPEWAGALLFLKKFISYFVVYCSQNIYKVLGSLKEFSDIAELEELGETCGYKAYKLIPDAKQFWVEFQNINFHPDDGLSHSYGYDESGNCVSSLETDDGINYLIVENIDRIFPAEWAVIDKNEVSNELIENIEDLTDGEDWKLLLISRCCYNSNNSAP